MYIEELIILNFIIDYILLDTINILLKNNVSKKKIILASLFGEISLIYLFINISGILMFIYKIIIGIIMILISFKYKDRKTYFTNLIYFYILSFFLGGILYYFKINSLIEYKYYLLLIPFFMNFYKYFSYELKQILTFKHKVSIYLNNGKVLYLDGYMDSGNNLIDPLTNKKVIIINKKVDELFYLVPFETIDSSALIKCFKPKKIFIDGIGERQDVVVGVIDKKLNGFDCLLNNQLMERI